MEAVGFSLDSRRLAGLASDHRLVVGEVTAGGPVAVAQLPTGDVGTTSATYLTHGSAVPAVVADQVAICLLVPGIE